MNGLIRQRAVLWFALLCAVLAWGAGCSSLKTARYDLGPVVSRLDDVHGADRFRCLGPVFESAADDQGRTLTAVRPVFAEVTDESQKKARQDWLWPVATSRCDEQEQHWRFLLAYFDDFDVNDATSRYRFVIFPVYFQGRSAEKKPYLAIFPLGGTIREYLWRDKIDFVLFPIWAKHSINDVVTTDWLWPIISKTEGKGIYRYRVFPFYARSYHRDKFEKRFYMWPFFTWARYKEPGHSGHAYIVWPLWGRVDLEGEKTWLFLPPLIRISRGERLDYSYYPWPFVQKSRGLVEKTYIWPFWGEKRMRGVYRAFVLWPLIWNIKVDRGDELDRFRMAIPFYYSATKIEKPKRPGERRTVWAGYRKLWPLCSWRWDEDESRFRLLELWPLRDTGPVERLYAPFWTLYSRTRYEDTVEHEFLWGLYRQRSRTNEEFTANLFPVWSYARAPDYRQWKMLGGLIGYERKAAGRAYWLLYFRMGARKEPAP